MTHTARRNRALIQSALAGMGVRCYFLGDPELPGADVEFGLSSFSTSRSNCFTHLSATSALAPLYFAPLLSWVLVQITSPSGLTRRIATLASFMVSVFTDESLVPMCRATNPP